MIFGHQNDTTGQVPIGTNADAGAATVSSPLGTDAAATNGFPLVHPTIDPQPTDVAVPLPSMQPVNNATTDQPTPNDTSTMDVAPTEPQAQSPASPLPADSSPQSAPPIASDDLLSLKQHALSQLSPLVNHLEQTPEEKFRTTMMMIQSTDNHELIKDAYEAAQAITDDKSRAQALLDVINEINYFTVQK